MNRCQHCNGEFATPSSLKRHISAKHTTETGDSGQTNKRHTCPHCHAYFARRETVRRHIRTKHEGELSICSFCLKQFRSDYMPQHRAVCARRYWRIVQQHANPSGSANAAPMRSQSHFAQSDKQTLPEDNTLHIQDEITSKAQEDSDSLRFFHERSFTVMLATDALPCALRHFMKDEDVESFKAALVTALSLNMTINDLDHAPCFVDFADLKLLAIAIDRLVRGGIQINDWPVGFGGTILHMACRAGCAELLEPLFWRGASLDAIDDEFRTPLDCALRSGDMDTARFILALGSDPNANDALFEAWDAGRQDFVTMLVEHGVDVNQQDYDGDTFLMTAVYEESLEKLRFVLSLGADPNLSHPIRDVIGYCMDSWCSGDCAHEEMACLLIEQGADPSVQGRHGWTTLHYAVDTASVRLLRAVLDRITSPLILNTNDDDGNTALHYAVRKFDGSPQHESPEVVSMLLDAGVDVNMQNNIGESALMIAACTCNDEYVKLLLDAGASVKRTDYGGNLALSEAARKGYGTVVRQLLEEAPPINEDHSYLTRALEEAVESNQEDIVLQLLAVGADPSAGDVLEYALQESSPGVVHMLLEAGAQFDNVSPDLMFDLFAVGNEDARLLGSPYVGAPAKCELLIRAFPDFRERYT
jgi:ankyrin repeat protein